MARALRQKKNKKKEQEKERGCGEIEKTRETGKEEKREGKKKKSREERANRERVRAEQKGGTRERGGADQKRNNKKDVMITLLLRANPRVSVSHLLNSRQDSIQVKIIT